jgi:hypothetical protein
MRFKRSSLVGAGAAAILTVGMFTGASAFASTTTITGSLTQGQVSTYTTPRSITVAGSNIYFRKTDGPQIQLRWYKCGNTSIHGAWVTFPNPDPTSRVAIGTNFASGTSFCLQALDQGSNSTDTFTGTLDWNVFS